MNDTADIRLQLHGARQVSAGAKQVARDMGRVDDAADRIDRSGRRANATMRSLSGTSRRGLSMIGGGVAALVGATGGLYAVGRGIGFAASEYDEAQRVGGQTNAVLKSTGGIANATRRDVERLAGGLSAKAGIDDEAIQSGANLLLTFKNVRNEAGKSNAVFNHATRSGLDMAVALGTDARGAALMLGKALNDPAKGLTKLERSGVSFSQKQKKQIAAMQEAGDLLGAQKLMLREIDAQFKGSAKAQAQPIDKMRVGFGNLAESMAGLAAPTVNAGISAAGEAVAALNQDLDKLFKRDDLSLEKKLELAVPLVRRNLRPLARELGGVIDDANLDDALYKAIEKGTPLMIDAAAAAAPRAAGAFVNAFTHAGPWGQFLTVAFLAHKLGAFNAVGGLAADKFVTAYGARTRSQHGKYKGMGKGIGRALGAGILLGIPFLVDDIREALGITPGEGALGQYSGKSGWGELGRDALDLLPGKDSEEKRAERRAGGRAQRRYFQQQPFSPWPKAKGSSRRKPVFAGASALSTPGVGGAAALEAATANLAAAAAGLDGMSVVLDDGTLVGRLERKIENQAARR